MLLNLGHENEGIYAFAPIPIYYKITDASQDWLINKIIEIAKAEYKLSLLDVPDERHIENSPFNHNDYAMFTENIEPAKGVWHGIKTNDFLGLSALHSEILALKNYIIKEYGNCVKIGDKEDGQVIPHITENWIQFYKNGDSKILHNHERYFPPVYKNMWSGAFYLSDGKPDKTVKYSGLFSFKIRGKNYYIRPQKGLMIMWQSDLLHEVHEFYGEEERIVLNWNIVNKA